MAQVIMGVYTKKSLKQPESGAGKEPKKDGGISKEATQKQLVMSQMDDSSNFSFDDFLKETIEWHNKAENENKPKTIKFNFDSIEATQNAVDVLVRKGKEVWYTDSFIWFFFCFWFKFAKNWCKSGPCLFHITQIKFPIWLGADVLQGPDPGAEAPQLDAKEFVDEVKKMEKVVLCVGWTSSRENSNAVYTAAHTNAMADVIKDNKLDKIPNFEVNFPIRAAVAVKSQSVLKQLYDLIKLTNPVTYTVFSKNEDKVNTTELQAFIKSYGVENVYIDVPNDLRKKLNLANGASSLIQFGLLNLIMLIIGHFFRNAFH